MFTAQENSPELLASIAAMKQRQAARAAVNPYPPAGWQKPSYGTREYYQARSYGWISEAQEFEDEARRQRAIRAGGTRAVPPSRHRRPEPQESRQYANHMATTAARDDRLTPQAKALLQVLRARCGNGTETHTTKTTLAAIMSRSVRSIQRYIQELVTFGYICAEIRRNKRGSHTGLILRLCQKVLPFWKDDHGLAVWLQQVDDRLPDPFDFTRPADMIETADLFDFTGRTEMSPKNYSPNLNIIIGRFAPLLAYQWQQRKRKTAT